MRKRCGELIFKLSKYWAHNLLKLCKKIIAPEHESIRLSN